MNLLRHIGCLFLLLGLSACFPGYAEDGYAFSFDAVCTRNLGYSTYDLEAADSETTVSSKLEFPIDAFLLGAKCTLYLGDAYERECDFSLGAACNITAPASKMLDHDWIEPTGAPKLKFSYTESDVTMFMLVIDARAHKKLASLGWMDLYLCFGYSFQYISQRINGYSGWQIDLETGDIYDVEGSGLAMLYDIYYHMPAVGVLFTMRPLPQLVIELEADAVLVIAHDVDDHVLRNKLSTAFGLGVGINSSVSLLYYIPCNETTRIYLGADIRFSFLFIPARQRQEWYADDPGTPGDDTGTVYTNIIHNISYLSLSGGLTAGVSYAF